MAAISRLQTAFHLGVRKSPRVQLEPIEDGNSGSVSSGTRSCGWSNHSHCPGACLVGCMGAHRQLLCAVECRDGTSFLLSGLYAINSQ